jgi:hypothetical protein
LRLADGEGELVLYDVAVDGEHAKSNLVLTGEKRLDSHRDSLGLFVVDRDVAAIDALAAGVDDRER